MDELRERTNPSFNGAKSTLVYLAEAGDRDAAVMARELEIEANAVFQDEQQEALSLGMMANVNACYEVMTELLAAVPEETIVDLGCGYTPRALIPELEGKHYIGCDLPIVIDEMAPLAKKLLAKKGRPAPAEYKAADFTNYASLRAALDGVKGPLCLTSESTLTYLTQSEVRQLCANVRRVLKEFGGRWVTPDVEAGDRTVGSLVAVLGEEGFKNVISVFVTLSNQADVVVGDNDMVIRYGHQEDPPAADALMKEVGLKVKKITMGDYMPELKVFSKLSAEQREAMKTLYKSLVLWELTPDPDWTEPEAKTGGEFGVDTAVNGTELTVALRGRVDSLTAPDFLAAFEKIAGEHALTAATVDMSDLEYISSAGLRVLLIMTKRLGTGHVIVTGANELVLSIFEQTGYDDILRIR